MAVFGCGIAGDRNEFNIRIPKTFNRHGDPVDFISIAENIEVISDASARVASNEKTGTIFAGEHVTVSEVALASKNLKIENAKLAMGDFEKSIVSCSIGPGAAGGVNIIRMQIREN